MDVKAIRQTVGMVVPVWFNPETALEQIEELLTATLESWEVFLLPERVVIVLDGCDWCLKPLKRVQKALQGEGWSVVVLERNMGKGGAVVAGIQRLLDTVEPNYIVVRDSDNDH
ncbi:MAG: glycosyltransferase, partial [Armatimonadota bacterium]